MPEIGLNGLLLDSPHSGTATYTRNLAYWLPRVAPDFTYRLFVRHADPHELSIPIGLLTTPIAPLNRGTATIARLDKLAWETIMFPLAALRHNQALIHSLYWAAPIIKPLPTVVTIHDLVPLLMPGYHRGRASALYARLMARAVRGAAAIITVSAHASQEISRTLHIPVTRIHITPEAADERFSPHPTPDEAATLRAKYALPHRFLLYLGGAEKRKNIELLIRAWHLIRREIADREITLLIVAAFPPPDPLYPDIPAIARQLDLTASIHFLPSVDEADKPALYRLALGFCFPSRYEGFGLTPLEAMASGLPVISSNATSLPEVVGPGGLLLDPDDIPAWADAMLSLVDNPVLRTDLSRRALDQAAHFSWRSTAEATAAVYRQVLRP
jgi:glycosyltransferase involved in cell wall biosynthesis